MWSGCRDVGSSTGFSTGRSGTTTTWTRKVAGKTITRRLTEREAALYTEWITNGRRIGVIVAEMEKISVQAAEILLRQAAPEPTT